MSTRRVARRSRCSTSATAQEFVGKPGFIDAVVGRAATAACPTTCWPTGSKPRSRLTPHTEMLTGAEITKENQDSIEEGAELLHASS